MKTKLFLVGLTVIVLSLNSAMAQKTKGNNTQNPNAANNINPNPQAGDLRTNLPNGNINWTTQYIEAKGESVIDTVRFKNKAQAKAMAIRGAVVVAQRNLLEIINGVRVVGETKVEDMITTHDYIYTRVDGLIKGAEMVGDPIEQYGTIQVTMRVPIYAQNGLAPVIYDVIPKRDVVDPNNRGDANNTDNNKKTDKKDDKAPKPENEEIQSVAFRLNNQLYDPAIFPLVVDEKGQVLLDFTKFYDPKSGKFPKILKETKDILELSGAAKGVKIIDVISAQDGKLVVSTVAKNKINWDKISESINKIGKILMLFM